METLAALHRAQVERVPYEVVWIALGETRTIEPLDSMAHLASGRGGYCYHLNGALGCLLDWLGFDVRWRAGGVQGRAEPVPAGATGSHLALEVHGLPTAECPDGRWFVDTGLGDALYEPLPLVRGTFTQTPSTFALRPSEVVSGGWRFDHDPRGSFLGMDFTPFDATVAHLEERHRELSTGPESGFVRVVTLSIRTATDISTLRGLVLEHLDSGGKSKTEIGAKADYFALLADVFALPLPEVDEARRAALWDRLRADHDRFLAAPQPTDAGTPQAQPQ
ncbi:Arylamine N-acetyltransferase [Actinokineospora iranica]|uniref:Arylamine N-acetyltransferase n=1 Tax=Actinokineospora iranica TaxID=1271860 RepID=A0A1G6UTU1_9PSEU|nr:Arylamine N-acetyltransferase [Actinokineospora iranica]